MAENTYTVIEEGQKLLEKLVEIYPQVLWRIRPGQIAILGIENKEPSKKAAKFKVRSVKNAEKAVMKMNNINIRYIIEMFWADWHKWDAPRQEWTLLKALLMISEDEGKLVKPDCTEFKIILDQVGFNWEDENSSLPSLTSGEPIAFDSDLLPGLDDEDAEED